MWILNGVEEKDPKNVKTFFGLKYKPMVQAITDTDLYKFSMGQVYHHQFPNMKTTWDFAARNVGEGKLEKYTAEDVEEIKKQFRAYCALRIEPTEISFLLKKCPWIKEDYIHFLKLWQPNFNDVDFKAEGDTGLHITFTGFQEYISYYEIPILEICAEVYYRNHYNYDELFSGFRNETYNKLKQMEHLRLSKYKEFGTWSEFGTRRRLSFESQEWLIQLFKYAKEQEEYINALKGFVGTSNVYLAMKYDLTPVGTCAHEFIECVGQGDSKKNPAYSNYYAMNAWVKEYGVWNGIWLTDTIGDELCRMDMKKTFCTLFQGVRNDSGDPKVWAENWITHYKDMGIDPTRKTLLFSNSIDNLELWTDLVDLVKGRAKPAFGIGTYWTGPQTVKPLNIVAKVVQVEGMDVAKLSDDDGKCMCRNPEYVDYLKRSIRWRVQSQQEV